MPDIGQCEILRNTYGYPPARLSRHPAPAPNTITWVGRHYQRLDPPPGWHGAGAGLTSRALDNYHSRLLNSHNPDDNVDGVMSSVYWGYYAGQNGRVNGYAETRAGWVLLGRPHGPVPSTVAQIHGAVAIAKLSMHTANYQAALTAIKGSITYIGRSFASKVIAFMDPVHCGVLDAVVQSKLANSASPQLNMIDIKHAGYQPFCDFCFDRAHMLNAAGSTWIDWDGTHCAWRAIDVERVIFASPGDPGPILI